MKSSFLRSFVANQHGSVAIITGLMMLSLVALAGASIDLGRQQLLRAKLQQATDAAAVAVAKMDENATDAQKRRNGRMYFNLNFPANYMGVTRPPVNIGLGEDITASATVDMPTRFITFVGVDEVASEGYTRMSSTALTTEATYDLFLTMDVSGSMGCSAQTRCGVSGPPPERWQALRTAANIIAQDLLENNTTNSRIAANTWGSNLGPRIAFQSTYQPMRDFLYTNINHSGGGTHSEDGLDHARSQLSQFRSDAVRAVVLLTDGVNSTPDDSLSLAICTDLKNRGIVVYTIALGKDVSEGTYAPRVRDFLSHCASGVPATNEDQYFFIAPDAAKLQTAFESILSSVKSMRILD